MKTKFIAIFAFVLFAVGNVAFAQSSASVTSTATIETPISASALSNLAFGTISKGATATVASSSSSAGSVLFSGDEGDNITITVPATATISTSSGAGASMTVTINRGGLAVNTSNDQNNANALDASSGTATTALSGDEGGNEVADGLGQAWLWIGGSVSPTSTQQRGVYTGTFTVSAAYSN
jgi:hypothetical protein